MGVQTRGSLAARCRVALCFALSGLVHVVALLLIDWHWQEQGQSRLFRARLDYRQRFIPPRLVRRPAPRVPAPEMVYLPSEQKPSEVTWSWPESAFEPAPLPDTSAAPRLRDEEVLAAKTAPHLEEDVELVAVSRWDPLAQTEVPELLRLADIARAGERRAMVIVDPDDRRQVRGFVRLRNLRMDGIEAQPVFTTHLAWYVRHYTRIAATADEVPTRGFLSESLLADPIHFMFKGRGYSPSNRFGAVMNADEIQLLGRYLRGGGFVFVESLLDVHGREDPARGTWIAAVVDYIRQALDPEGGLFEVPTTHPVYHSFHDFRSGFPGEKCGKMEGEPSGGRWEYPRWSRCDGPRGLWGVEYRGETVALISDLGLHASWRERPGDPWWVPTPYLAAGTNILVYALTRPNSPAVRGVPVTVAAKTGTPPAAVSQHPMAGGNRRRSTDPDSHARGTGERRERTGGTASIALVHSPLGRLLESAIELSVDARAALDVGGTGAHAVLVHGLPAGRHTVGLEYDGRASSLEVDMPRDRTLAIRFSVRRLLILRRLHVAAERRTLAPQAWRERFSDLTTLELYCPRVEMPVDPNQPLPSPLGGDR